MKVTRSASCVQPTRVYVCGLSLPLATAFMHACMYACFPVMYVCMCISEISAMHGDNSEFLLTHAQAHVIFMMQLAAGNL